MSYKALTSLIIFEGVMYDCTAKVKKDVCAMRGISQKYARRNELDAVYYVSARIRAYIAQAMEEGNAAYAGIAKEAA